MTRPHSALQQTGFASGERGRLILWRQGRLVYQDPRLKWWFAYGW